MVSERWTIFKDGYTIEVSQESRRGVLDNWYIQVTHPDGCYLYDGWWNDSREMTALDAIEEAKAGALLDIAAATKLAGETK